MIIIQRIREYHNPSANSGSEEKYTVFMINLLRYYLKNEDKTSILNHLKELCSLHGSVFSSYLKNKLIKIVEGVKMIQLKMECDHTVLL